MQVSQDRPVYNEEKGEKISANAFLLDVEDVGELDDAKVVALASAEAWDAETEEPISIKTVEYDIKPETGNYTVTFATANDTSITVKVLVVAQNRVESKVYQEEIYAMNFFKKVEDIQESIALDTDLETWASASAWSLEDGEQVEIIAASVRSANHVTQCALMGADIATVPFGALKKCLKHPLTDQGMASFDADWAKVVAAQ